MTPELSRRLLGSARRFASKHPMMRSHVDDLDQVAMVAVWRTASTDALATVVARRAMVDYARATWGRMGVTRQQARVLSLDALRDDRVWPWEPSSADDTADEAVEHVDVMRVLARRRPRYRLAMVLRAAGWELAEIGDVLGVTESRVCQMFPRDRRVPR